MNTTPTIQFYGGIGTIGGTKIIIQEGEHRVIFDFGLSYAPGGEFWGGKVQPRSGTGRLRDFLTLGYLPRVDGLYRPDDAATVGLRPGSGDKTHVFISHLHLDHMGVLETLADDIPVWMHEDSLKLFRAVATTGERPAVPPSARAFQWGETVEVGPIKVTPLAVDHDIPGASGLLIETSAGTVVYTGDLRLHGSHPELIEEFIRQARAKNPRILLIEGTRIGEPAPSPDRPPALTEPEIAPRIASFVRETKGLALLTVYPRNTDRIAELVKALEPTGRKLVLSPEAAYIYQAMGGQLSEVAVFRRSQDEAALANGSAPEWLTTLLASATVLDTEAIRANQTAYVLQLFYTDINELVDLQPQEGSVFIHSNGEPLGRFDPNFEIFTRWLEHFSLELLMAPATGHAAKADLVKIIQGIAPQLLMPIHSKNPELVEAEGIARELPELGAHYEIATGNRVN